MGGDIGTPMCLLGRTSPIKIQVEATKESLSKNSVYYLESDPLLVCTVKDSTTSSRRRWCLLFYTYFKQVMSKPLNPGTNAGQLKAALSLEAAEIRSQSPHETDASLFPERPGIRRALSGLCDP